MTRSSERQQSVPPHAVRSSNIPETAALDAPFVDEAEPTGVMGTLREMPVIEIVQTLSHALKDAVVEVKPRDDEAGVIVFDQGRIVHCRTVSRAGESAFFRLLEAERGFFRIRYGKRDPAPVVRNIHRDTTFLLLEGVRLRDEARAHIPEPDAAEPALTPTRNLILTGGVPRREHDAVASGAGDDSLRVDQAQAVGEQAVGEQAVGEQAVAADRSPKVASESAADGDPERPAGASSERPPSRTGLFLRFFDEAGVPAPADDLLPAAAARQFQSLAMEQRRAFDDLDAEDSQATRRERSHNPTDTRERR